MIVPRAGGRLFYIHIVMDKSNTDSETKRIINISPKDRRIVKAKIKGKTHDEIAAVEYPNAKPENRRSIISQRLAKPNVAQYQEQVKLQALKEHNITWSRIIKPISDGLDAEKQNQFTGEITPDLNTRLRASKQAQELLQDKSISNDEVKEKLLDIKDGADEVEIQSILFKRNS